MNCLSLVPETWEQCLFVRPPLCRRLWVRPITAHTITAVAKKAESIPPQKKTMKATWCEEGPPSSSSSVIWCLFPCLSALLRSGRDTLSHLVFNDKFCSLCVRKQVLALVLAVVVFSPSHCCLFHFVLERTKTEQSYGPYSKAVVQVLCLRLFTMIQVKSERKVGASENLFL